MPYRSSPLSTCWTKASTSPCLTTVCLKHLHHIWFEEFIVYGSAIGIISCFTYALAIGIWQGSFFPQIFRHVTEHTENHITNYKNGVGFVQLGTVSSTAVGCQIHYGLWASFLILLSKISCKPESILPDTPLNIPLNS